MDKWNIGDKDERSAHAKIKMSIESLADPKMEEQKLQSVAAPVLPSPKKQDALIQLQGKSIQLAHLLSRIMLHKKGEAA